MHAHVLLNLFNELKENDKVQGLPSIISCFCNELTKTNYTRTRVRMLY